MRHDQDPGKRRAYEAGPANWWKALPPSLNSASYLLGDDRLTDVLSPLITRGTAGTRDIRAN